VQDSDTVQWNTNRKLNRITTLPVTFSDTAVWNLSITHRLPRELQHILSTICWYLNQKVHMTGNFNYLFEKGLLTVIARHIHSKCGNISETVPDRCYYKSLSDGGNSDNIESPSRSFVLQAFQMSLLPVRRYAGAVFAVIACPSDCLSQVEVVY